MTNWNIQQAGKILLSGGVITYPTEAVYGLGCVPGNAEAVLRILSLKQRQMEKGLIVVAADMSQLEDLVDFDRESGMRKRVMATWPGAVTWLVPARNNTPVWLTGIHKSLAVRVSSHPAIQALCSITGPLVSTSANPAGYPPARTALKVRNYFGDRLDYYLHGNVAKDRQPTEIRDVITNEIIRFG